MANKKSTSTRNGEAVSKRPNKPPRSLSIAKNGINNAQEFLALMSAIMSDLLEETLMPQTAHAVCNAGGKLLKMVELNQKYGQQQVDKGMRNLQLVSPQV